MKVYSRDDNLYTEKEVLKIVKSDVENLEYYLDYINNLPSRELWSMFTEKAKAEVMEICIKNLIEDEFTMREF